MNDGQDQTLEQALEENRQLEQTLRLYQVQDAELLAQLGQKIRTPLDAVLGLAELLAHTTLDSQQESYVAGLLDSAKTLREVLDNAIPLPNAESRAGLSEGGYLTDELLAEVGNVMGLRAEDKGLLLRIDVRPDVPRGLWGDAVRLKQVILSLLAGAIERTEKGVVSLWLDIEPGSDDAVTLLCRVGDTSVGCGPSLLGEAGWQQLVQASPSLEDAGKTVRDMGGQISHAVLLNGGLAFTLRVPQVVVDHRPLVRVEHKEGLKVLVATIPQRGEFLSFKLKTLGVEFEVLSPGEELRHTGFTHCLYDHSVAPTALRAWRTVLPNCAFAVLQPIRNPKAPATWQDAVLHTPLLISGLARLLNRYVAKGPAEKAVVTVADHSGELAVRDALLLVVDDNEVSLMVAEEMLRALGAEVECAESGREALNLVAKTKYDVIFLDHMMPDIDGLEVTRRLRSRPGPNQQTPIVALTANMMDDVQSYYVRHGMDDYLGKPMEYDVLGQMLCRWLPPDKVVATPRGGHAVKK